MNDAIDSDVPTLAWDEPLVFGHEAQAGKLSVELVQADKAQSHVRRAMAREYAREFLLTAGVAGIGGLLWALAAEGSFLFAFGLIVTVRVLTRLAFTTSEFMDEWLGVPGFRGGRLEIYRDRIRRVDHEGREFVWPAAEIRQVRLKEHRHWRGGRRRVMSVRFPRTRSYHVVIPDDVSFDRLEAVLKASGIQAGRPRS